MSENLKKGEIEIKKKWVDETGVNIRYENHRGNQSEINLPIEYNNDDRWKEKLKQIVAENQAKFEHEKEKPNNEYSLEMNKINNEKVENEKIDLSDDIERRKKWMKETGRPKKPSQASNNS